MHGLRTNPRLPDPGNNQKDHQGLDPIECQDFIKLSQQQKIGMDLVRGKFMFYSYCNDPKRFSVKPPACKERKPYVPPKQGKSSTEYNSHRIKTGRFQTIGQETVHTTLIIAIPVTKSYS